MSYSAPPSTTTTFFVDTLSSASQIGTAGTFAGSVSTQNNVSYKDITTIYEVAATTAASWFKFYLNSDDTASDIVGVTGGTDPVFTTVTSSSNSITVANKTSLKNDYVAQSALNVFGSREAANLFNNRGDIETGYDSANTAVVDAANTAGAVSATKVTSSKEVTEAIVLYNSERFALSYNAVIVANGVAAGNNAAGHAVGNGTGVFANGTTLDATISSSDSAVTTQASIKVVCSDTTTITNLQIYDASATNLPDAGTGVGYAAGQTLYIKKGSDIIKIASINSVQAAMLNGTLDDSLKKELIRGAAIVDGGLAAAATVVGSGAGNGSFVSGDTTVTPTGSAAGVGAICNINMAADGTTINSIRVTTQGTGSESNIYAAGEILLFTNGPQQISLTLTAAMLKLFNPGVNGGGSGIWGTVGTTTGLAVTKISGSGSGDGAVVTVVTTSTTAIKSITVTTNATSDYAEGDVVEIYGSLGDTIRITLTAVQAQILNGGATAGFETSLTGFVPTSPPLESGDKIRLKFTINSAAGQKDTKGNDISYAQSYYVDYQLS